MDRCRYINCGSAGVMLMEYLPLPESFTELDPQQFVV